MARIKKNYKLKPLYAMYAMGRINKVINEIENEEQDIYVVELDRFNISNDNTNATETTIGINEALVYAKAAGYKRVKLPKGHYSLDTSVINPVTMSDGTKTFTYNRKGICMQSNLELILKDCILEMIPTDDPYYTILTIVHCNNSKITGGTIIGDKLTHNYGMRIYGNELELGSIDEETGEEVSSTSDVRTGFIEKFIKYDTNEEIELPSIMALTPLWNTYQNSVYGTKKIFCYDENDVFLGICANKKMGEFTLLENTKKIKVVIPNEAIQNHDFSNDIFALTPRNVWWTHEFGTGIVIGDGDNIEINGTTIRDCIGDCIATMAPPIDTTVNNIKIMNCDLSSSRRQGISLVGTGENYLIQNCKIHDINGIDPQFGIDIEHYKYVKDVLIDNCDFYNNRKGDIDNYNGTSGIEIKNSRFNGIICSIYGKALNVHDCTFEYIEGINDSNKIARNNCGLSLDTESNISYNNIFKNANYIAKNTSSISYGNTVIGGNVTIGAQVKENETSDKFFNCNVSINSYDGMYISNIYFENCEIRETYNKNNIEMKKVVFINTNYYLFNKLTFNECEIDMSDKSFLNGYKMQDGSGSFGIFNDCIFKNSYKNEILLFDTSLNMTFNKCNFYISRYRLAINRNSISKFNNCSLVFNDLNTSTSIVQIDSGWSDWYFNNCYFKSTLPVKIYSGNITDCTFDGNIMLS